jgi:hypothetical protein
MIGSFFLLFMDVSQSEFRARYMSTKAMISEMRAKSQLNQIQ